VHVRHRISYRVEIDIPLAERIYEAAYFANYESDSVNVEGAELSVLEGAKNLASNSI